ncbi:MAG: ArnT family glycosyltransferase [Nitrospinota bacterium]
MKMLSRSNANPIYLGSLCILFLILFAIKAKIIGAFGLTDQEAVYFSGATGSNLLSQSDLSFSLLIIYIADKLSFTDPFSLRITFLIGWLLTTLFLYRLAADLFNDKTVAIFATLLFALIPIYHLNSILVNNDLVAVFGVVLFCYLLRRGTLHSNLAYLITTGLLIATFFAIDRVILIILLVAGIVLIIRQKNLNRKRERIESLLALLFGFLSGMFILAGIGIVSRFEFGRLLIPLDLMLMFENIIRYHLLFITPILAILLIYGNIVSVKLALRGDYRYMFIVVVTVPFLLLGLIFSIVAQEEAARFFNIGYAISTIGLAAILSTAKEKMLHKGYRRFRWILSVTSLIAIVAIVIIHAELFVKIGEDRPLIFQSSDEPAGWEEIGKLIKTEHEILKLKGEEGFILADSLRLCAQLNYAVNAQIDLVCASNDEQSNRLFSSYEAMKSQSAIILVDSRFRSNLFARYKFQKDPEELVMIPIYKSGKKVAQVRIYIGEEFQGIN